eukprot:7089666-Prymnesium_polylepis.2
MPPPRHPVAWFRATLLYAIAPYDRTTWGTIRSPLFCFVRRARPHHVPSHGFRSGARTRPPAVLTARAPR